MHHEFFHSAGVRLGQLRTAAPAAGGHGEFGEGLIFEFPRATARIQAGERDPFITDTTAAWCRQPAAPCVRSPLRRELVSDWIWVSRSVLARATGVSVDSMDAAMPMPLPADVFLRQRALFAELRRGGDTHAVEEAAIAVISQLIAVRQDSAMQAHASPRQRELADAAKGVLGTWRSGRPRVPDLAQRLGCSVFYLCHTFRRVEQTTLTAYFAQLRLRAAVQRLLDGRRSELSDLAFELGFSSHSHFTAVFRRAFGTTPSALAGLAGRVAC